MRGLILCILSGLLLSLLQGNRLFAATPPVSDNPFAPAVEQVQGRFDVIADEIDRLQALGLDEQALAMQAELSRFQDELAGLAPSSLSTPEMDIIGVYSGFGTSVNVQSGPAYVHVTASDRPIVLALSSYAPVTWNLTVEEGASIEKIILCSYETGSSCNLPPGAQFQQVRTYVGSRLDLERYPSGERELRNLSGGVPVTSFNGLSVAPVDAFVIGSASPDWRAQRVLREMQGLYDQATAHRLAMQLQSVAHLRFPGLLQHLTPGYYFPTRKTSFGQMSVTASVPGSEVKLSTNLNHIAVDPTGNSAYGIASQTLYRVNLATGLATQMAAPADPLPPLSWPCGITYDTTRNRMILCSLGGEGSIYGYSPESQEWSLISSLIQNDLDAMVYLPSTDSLYGLGNGIFSDRRGSFKLYRYDMQGTLMGTIDIGGIIPSLGQPGHELQMMVAGDRLAILTGLTPDLYQLDRPDAYRMFIVEPSDGSVVYSGIFNIPEPTMYAAAFLVLMPRRRSCTRD